MEEGDKGGSYHSAERADFSRAQVKAPEPLLSGFVDSGLPCSIASLVLVLPSRLWAPQEAKGLMAYQPNPEELGVLINDTGMRGSLPSP